MPEASETIEARWMIVAPGADPAVTFQSLINSGAVAKW
jgi:hypothetical protein